MADSVGITRDRSADVMVIGERSAGDIVQDVLRDVGDVVRGEVRLARAEIAEKARRAGKAGGLMGAAALFGFFAFAALTTCFIVALGIVLPLWLAALIICVLFAIVAGAAYSSGRAKLREISPAPLRTMESVREDVRTVKEDVRAMAKDLKEDMQWPKHRTT